MNLVATAFLGILVHVAVRHSSSVCLWLGHDGVILIAGNAPLRDRSSFYSPVRIPVHFLEKDVLGSESPRTRGPNGSDS